MLIIPKQRPQLQIGYATFIFHTLRFFKALFQWLVSKYEMQNCPKSVVARRGRLLRDAVLQLWENSSLMRCREALKLMRTFGHPRPSDA